MKKSKHQRNKERQGVLGFIKENPGCGIGQIANEHDLSDRSVGNYLTTLALEGEIEIKYENGMRVAYPRNASHSDGSRCGYPWF